MAYRLPSHVSFGLVHGRAVVLDLKLDRYLLLGSAETDALRALGSTDDPLPLTATRNLLVRGLICEGSGEAIAPVEQEPPLASALETGEPGSGISAWEAMRHCIGNLMVLRVGGLSRLLERARTARARGARRAGGRLADDRGRAAGLARGFSEARIAVPMPRLCIPDSLALAQCLWRRGISADLLFGVQLDPLLAHAWVQSGPLVLSDPLNIVADYSPVFKL